MNILVTGAKGFIGKNLVLTLQNIRNIKNKQVQTDNDFQIFEYDQDTDKKLLEIYCKSADFVFHLAGVNRPHDQSEYMEGNFGFTSVLLDTLKKYHNTCPVMLSSSIQAGLEGRYAGSEYGKSKKAGEDLLLSYGKETGASVYIYRFPNVFGKWCRPNYNSAIATFCHNIACGESVHVHDRNVEMTLVYIDDVVEELIRALYGNAAMDEKGYCYVPVEYHAALGELVDMIYSFQECREKGIVADMTEGSLSKKLYATYISYLPEDKFCTPLNMHVDERGSFTEILRTIDKGQFSVNISKPGTVKGEHWHHTKNEKFLVVSGKALIRLRKVGIDPVTKEQYPVIEYHVSGEALELVDIPTGYTHNIINEGECDLVTFMWSSECFDPERLDTYRLKVEE